MICKINMGKNFGCQLGGNVAHIYELSASGRQRNGKMKLKKEKQYIYEKNRPSYTYNFDC